MVHWGINIGINGELHRIDFKKLVGKRVTIYGQQEVVKDLVAQRLADGGPLLFEVDDVSVHDSTASGRKIRFTHGGKDAGDRVRLHRRLRRLPRHLPPEPPGRRAARSSSATIRSAGSAFSPKARRPDEELIYSYTDRGFALYTMRSPTLSRLYLQCDHDEDIANWPDDRIWEELHKRLGGARKLQEGPIAAEGHHRRCAASSPSRCSTAAYCSPATAPISCRRPARRA